MILLVLTTSLYFCTLDVIVLGQSAWTDLASPSCEAEGQCRDQCHRWETWYIVEGLGFRVHKFIHILPYSSTQVMQVYVNLRPVIKTLC